MTRFSSLSRRNFLRLSAGATLMLGFGRMARAQTAIPGDYKALVCLFLFGGNDGHNLVVPLETTQYGAYANARGALALPLNQLLAIHDSAQGSFGLHYAMPELRSLYNSGDLAILANVGMLVRPTSYSQWQTNGFEVPLNLRSHSDQTLQMQTAVPDASGSTGWGGRALDKMEFDHGYNATTAFPVSVSMRSPAMFCSGEIARNVSIQPGNAFAQQAMSLWLPAAAQARQTAQRDIVATTTGNLLVDAANKSMADGLELQPLLQQAATSITFAKPFPNSGLGSQLAEVARIIGVSRSLGVGRQVFFCSLGGFDTHAGQSYQQWSLLQELSQALDAFHAATVQLDVADSVTSFTLSDFGRTLQPSGSGSDHGWGNHHLVVGGAVRGGRIYGRFPSMTNYANFNASADDFADPRGTMLPTTSLSQVGATLARWFGANDAELDDIFAPTLANFALRDLGFLS